MYVCKISIPTLSSSGNLNNAGYHSQINQRINTKIYVEARLAIFVLPAHKYTSKFCIFEY